MGGEKYLLHNSSRSEDDVFQSEISLLLLRCLLQAKGNKNKKKLDNSVKSPVEWGILRFCSMISLRL